MYLTVDIGATKTLLAAFTKDGALRDSYKFATPDDYHELVKEFEFQIKKFGTQDFRAAAVAVPGKLDREHGIGLAFGNRPWLRVPIAADFEKIVSCPVLIENDTKLAALSEAILIINDFKRVLYVTISTGISAGLVVNGILDVNFADSESGHMRLEHEGKLQTWQSFASGKAIVAKYGKRASEITDKASWRTIAHNIAVGLIDLIAVVQPEVIVLGGGVGAHFNKFSEPLIRELKKYEIPLVPIPPIVQAKRPEEAVIYGCYDLLKMTYAKIH